MLLGIDELRQLVRENNLVEGLLESEFRNSVGTGFDLRVGELHAIAGKSYVGKDGRVMPETRLLASHLEGVGHHAIGEKEYYLIKTIEKLNLPDDVMAVFYPGSTFHRAGIHIITGLADPGYRGELTFGISNMSAHDFILQMGSRIAHALFFRVSGARPYQGKWQGGRMA